MPPADPIAARKAALRRAVRGKTRALSPEYRARASADICRRLLALPELAAAPAVLGFCPTPAEPDITPALEALLARGTVLALPRCLSPGVMEARRAASLSGLAPGPYGLLEPGGDASVIPREALAFAIVPCMAADLRGGRLGHGGGYYDRFLLRGEMPAALVCFAALIQEAVPMGELDVPIPLVVTEEGVWREGIPG